MAAGPSREERERRHQRLATRISGYRTPKEAYPTSSPTDDIRPLELGQPRTRGPSGGPDREAARQAEEALKRMRAEEGKSSGVYSSRAKVHEHTSKLPRSERREHFRGTRTAEIASEQREAYRRPAAAEARRIQARMEEKSSSSGSNRVVERNRRKEK